MEPALKSYIDGFAKKLGEHTAAAVWWIVVLLGDPILAWLASPPFEATNLLFFAAWPMLAACIALYALRDADILMVDGWRQSIRQPGAGSVFAGKKSTSHCELQDN